MLQPLVIFLRNLIQAAVAGLFLTGVVAAATYLQPTDPVARHDLLRLERSGVIDIPVTTWPLPLQVLRSAIERVNPDDLADRDRLAYERLARVVRPATGSGKTVPRWGAAVSRHPQEIRGLINTPRERAEIFLGTDWHRGVFDLSLNASVAPDSDDKWRFDGSYIAMELGDWLMSAGYEERWWGPGNSGSLLLSTNARPVPALSIQRSTSRPFESRWLSWLGPWTMSVFMGQLGDDRTVPDPLLFGMRFVFRPANGLEIGVSRTAQWCGDNRPCDAGTFIDLLLGKDNRGVNVDPADEPGNQLGGIDARWSLIGRDISLYAQWIAEDTRQGGPELGSWLRQAGIERSGTLFGLPHHSFLEVSDTACRDGGLGFSEAEADCAYNHATYTSGYRYRGRPLGHGADGDSLIYSIGTTLVQSDGHSWTATMRRMTINRIGEPDEQHSLAETRQDRYDMLLNYRRMQSWGSIEFGLGFQHIDATQVSGSRNDINGFIRWTTH